MFRWFISERRSRSSIALKAQVVRTDFFTLLKQDNEAL